jgi:hypothetical protein
MKSILLLLLASIIFLSCSYEEKKTVVQDDLKIAELKVTELPLSIKYEGKINNAVRWQDKLGDNIVITTETGIFSNKKNKDFNDAELYAYHFLVKNDSAIQTWKVYDHVDECNVDIEANFVKNTFQITDLNKDGVGEVWLMYKTACHGDVSPCSMKIIMYQGSEKFAMRGRNKVQFSTDQFEGGEYKFDKDFINSPGIFREFAQKLWNKNIMQVWG